MLYMELNGGLNRLCFIKMRKWSSDCSYAWHSAVKEQYIACGMWCDETGLHGRTGLGRWSGSTWPEASQGGRLSGCLRGNERAANAQQAATEGGGEMTNRKEIDHGCVDRWLRLSVILKLWSGMQAPSSGRQKKNMELNVQTVYHVTVS